MSLDRRFPTKKISLRNRRTKKNLSKITIRYTFFPGNFQHFPSLFSTWKTDEGEWSIKEIIKIRGLRRSGGPFSAASPLSFSSPPFLSSYTIKRCYGRIKGDVQSKNALTGRQTSFRILKTFLILPPSPALNSTFDVLPIYDYSPLLYFWSIFMNLTGWNHGKITKLEVILEVIDLCELKLKNRFSRCFMRL